MKNTAYIVFFSIVFGAIGGGTSSQVITPITQKFFSEETQEIAHESDTVAIYQDMIESITHEIETNIKESISDIDYQDYQQQMIDAVQNAQDSVVSIVATKDVQIIQQNPFLMDPFFQQFFQIPGDQLLPEGAQGPQTEKRKIGGGTGFLMNKEGIILTNKHVVSNESAEYSVFLSDGKQYSIEVLYRDILQDLAVLQIVSPADDSSNTEIASGSVSLPEFPSIKMGNSENVEVGQTVIAIGNALAEYSNTVTSGIVSAKERNIYAGDGYGQTSEKLSGLIQTDAAINPGNSGGPLINLKGEVIGINTAMDASARGIGFAIPINDVQAIVASIEKYGEVIRPYLGVHFRMLTPEFSDQLGIKTETGAIIIGSKEKMIHAVVPESPADKAGLKAGDIIIAVNGIDLNADYTLVHVVAQHQIDDILDMKVWRDGEEIELDITLGVFEE